MDKILVVVMTLVLLTGNANAAEKKPVVDKAKKAVEKVAEKDAPVVKQGTEEELKKIKALSPQTVPSAGNTGYNTGRPPAVPAIPTPYKIPAPPVVPTPPVVPQVPRIPQAPQVPQAPEPAKEEAGNKESEKEKIPASLYGKVEPKEVKKAGGKIERKN